MVMFHFTHAGGQYVLYFLDAIFIWNSDYVGFLQNESIDVACCESDQIVTDQVLVDMLFPQILHCIVEKTVIN